MIDTSFLDSLIHLRLSFAKNSPMALSGNRKSSMKGNSTEFSGFREYHPGDDPRRIDWNAYGRLNKLYMKEYLEEKEIPVHILLDTSASMDYGQYSKRELAAKLSLALSFIARNNMDRVFLFDVKNPTQPFPVSGGRKSFLPLCQWLERLSYGEDVHLLSSLKKISFSGAGITILISDFLDEELINHRHSTASLLRYLQYQKQKTLLLQILSPEEEQVELTGTLNLLDREGRDSLKVTMDRSSISRYEKELASLKHSLQTQAARFGAFYCLCNTREPFSKIIFEKLRFAYDI